MPLQDTLDTFGYLVKEADKLQLAYICFLRYTKTFDVEIDGWFLFTFITDLFDWHPLTIPLFYLQENGALRSMTSLLLIVPW